MKLLNQIIQIVTLSSVSSAVFAHAGHHGEGLSANLLHSFSGGEALLIVALIISATMLINRMGK